MPGSVLPDPVVGVRETLFAVVVLVCGVLLVPTQLASMILFDSTGLDTRVPSVVFMAVLPASTLALVPGALAWRSYGRREAFLAIAGLGIAYVAIATYLIRFYRIG